MGLILLIAFICTPIVEIALFIEAGERFGLWPTLGAVIATAIAGTWLLRWQGFATWARATQSLQRNVFPMAEVFTGLCLVLAGALLLTPGFLTDAIGLALFAPPVRNLLARLLRRRLQRGGNAKVWVNGEAMDFSSSGPGPSNRGSSDGGPRGPVVDAEFKEIDTPAGTIAPDGHPKGNPDSPWRNDKKS